MNSELHMHDLNNLDPEIRRRAAEIYFTEPISGQELELLIGLISDPDKGVRDAAGMALAFNDNPQIPALVVPLVSSTDITVRNLAGDILLKRGTEVIPAMLGYLPKGDDDDKKFVIDILGLIGDPTPAPEIIKILLENENENVILACAEALGNLKYEPAVFYLVQVYNKNELYGPTVVEALGKIGSLEACKFIKENYGIANDLTKFSMLESLGDLGDEDTFFFLLNELPGSDIPYTWAIILSLTKLKERFGLDLPYDESTKQKILSTLTDADKQYRIAASSLIVSYKEEDALSACLEIYGDDWEIDANILPYLCQNGTVTLRLIMDSLDTRKENLRPVLELLKNFLVEWNGESLGSLEETEIVNLCDSLSNNLAHPDEEVRKLAMELLFMIRTPMALIFFDRMVSDPVLWNRLRLIELVEQYAPNQLKEYLVQFTNDPEEMIRERAHSTLEENSSNSEAIE